VFFIVTQCFIHDFTLFDRILVTLIEKTFGFECLHSYPFKNKVFLKYLLQCSMAIQNNVKETFKEVSSKTTVDKLHNQFGNLPTSFFGLFFLPFNVIQVLFVILNFVTSFDFHDFSLYVVVERFYLAMLLIYIQLAKSQVIK